MDRSQNVNDTADHRGVPFNETMKQKHTEENRNIYEKPVESGVEEQSLGLTSLPESSWLIYFVLCSVFDKNLLRLFSASAQVAKALLAVVPKDDSY